MILLAVVLFAALNYAVTSSMQGNTKSGSTESAEAAAAEILQWFAAVDNAVMRMKLNGIAYEDMSFVYDAKFYGDTPLSNYQNNTRCAVDTCRVFKTDGGGIIPPNFVTYATASPTGAVAGAWLKPGYMVTMVIQWPEAGTTSNDIALRLVYLSPAVCDAINKKAGITKSVGFSGTYTQAYNPSNWDSAGLSISTNSAQVKSNNVFSVDYAGSGSGSYCNVYYLIIRR